MQDQENADMNRRAEYTEVCSSFRLLTEIRFKLLTLLPIGTAAGVVLTANAKSSFLAKPLVGLFGLAVTVCAAIYNLRNDQLYDELVARAAHLERLLNLKEGAFAQRPRPWLYIGPVEVTHRQIWWIYLSSFAAWLSLILHGVNALWLPGPKTSHYVLRELIEAVAVIALTILMAWFAYEQDKKNSNSLKDAAQNAVSALTQVPLSSTPLNHDAWNCVLLETSFWRATARPEVRSVSG
jgi:hypothetical protein